MIILCVNCNKKFNVNSKLIPSKGRLIQCSVCSHTWHYKIKEVDSKALILDAFMKPHLSETDSNYQIIDNENLADNKTSTVFNKKIEAKVDSVDIKIENKSISNLFSYLVVFIISFIALLILVDTLKSPLINIFPQLEIILFNLYETLKDVKLFIIDLT